jgi:catechol 2,3-dioxygenase-like lactoylglutathione lyase family enzyme
MKFDAGCQGERHRFHHLVVDEDRLTRGVVTCHHPSYVHGQRYLSACVRARMMAAGNRVSLLTLYSAGRTWTEGILVLLKGLNHVAILTNDAARLVAFYKEVFEAEVLRDGSEFPDGKGPRLTIIKIGEWSELNVFQIEGNTQADHQTPMFERGRLDHLAVQAASVDSFETIRGRLMARGAADDFVTDFGPMLSIFFRDPDGLECEVCVENPDLVPGAHNPPGTRAARYS